MKVNTSKLKAAISYMQVSTSLEICNHGLNLCPIRILKGFFCLFFALRNQCSFVIPASKLNNGIFIVIYAHARVGITFIFTRIV